MSAVRRRPPVRTEPPARRPTTRRPGRSVSSRLVSSLAVYLLLLVVLAGVGVANAVVIGSGGAAELRQERLRQANTEMLLAMTNAETGVRGYRLAGDRAFLEPYDRGRAAFPRAVRAAADLSDRQDERDLVRAQRDVGRGWFADFADVGAARPADAPPPTLEQALARKAAFDRFRALNTRLDVLVDRRARAVAAETERARQVVLVTSVAVLALALAAAVAVHRRLRASLVTPLGLVVTTLGRLSAGRHDARADAGLGPYEVQVVAASLNALADEADRLRAERAESERYHRLAVDIGRDLRDELIDGDPVTTVLRRLGDALGVDRAYLRLVDEEERGENTHQWQRPPWAPLPTALADEAFDRTTASRLRQAYADLQLWSVEDLGVRALNDPHSARYAQTHGGRAVLSVPVGAGDRALGLLTAVVMDRPRAWTHDERALVTSVAADLGRALVVRRLLEQQERLVDRLRELDRTKTEFVATVSHELRTPLTSIAGYVEMVREGDGGQVPPAMDAMLAVVERNTARLRLLIEDLLTLSRIESGTYRVSHGEVAPVQVASMAVQSLRPAADKARVGVHLDLGGEEEGAALVSGDPGQLERAVGNLLSNAVKFTPAGGLVRVSVRLTKGRVVIEVADTGIGIPQAEQEQLFTRFFRASNATELAIQGTGLGLTIVRSIVELHEGTLTVASVPGEGTTVTVDLPRLAGPASAAAAAASRAAVAAAVASVHHHEAAGAPLVAR